MTLSTRSLRYRFLALGVRHNMFYPPRTRIGLYMTIVMKPLLIMLAVALLTFVAVVFGMLTVAMWLGELVARPYRALCPRRNRMSWLGRFLNEPVEYAALQNCCELHREQRIRLRSRPA